MVLGRAIILLIVALRLRDELARSLLVLRTRLPTVAISL